MGRRLPLADAACCRMPAPYGSVGSDCIWTISMPQNISGRQMLRAIDARAVRNHRAISAAALASAFHAPRKKYCPREAMRPRHDGPLSSRLAPAATMGYELLRFATAPIGRSMAAEPCPASPSRRRRRLDDATLEDTK